VIEQKIDVEVALRATLHELRVHQIELQTQNEELRRTQLLLDQSNARYFDFYNLAPVGYCLLSEQGIVLEANLTLTSMLGMGPNTMTGERISRFIDREQQDIYYLFRQLSFKTQLSQSCDVKIQNVQGRQIWVNLVSNLTLDSLSLPLLRLVVTDVTDRKLMSAAMEASEVRYRAMVDWSPEATLIHKSGKILYANQAAAHLLGAKASHEIVNTLVTDWVRRDLHDTLRNRWAQVTELYVSMPMSEQVILRKDGESRDVEVNSISTLYLGELAIQVVVNDVTERKRREEISRLTSIELQESKTKADEANAAKSYFLASIGHDLRTPLHSIIGYAQLLESSLPALNDAQLINLKQVLESSWYLLKLINELLDLANIEAGQCSISMQSTAIYPLLEECESILDPLAKQRGITMERFFSETPCFALVDATRLKQVLCNLLSNAIKYNRQGGLVGIECVATDPNRIRLSISDTGQGLSEEQMAQLFQPFHRLEKSDLPEDGSGRGIGSGLGLGLGLVVSKRLIELMDGTIGVASTVGVGSTFWVEINQTLG
jgi:PAS domain S-box-containing protein